MKHLFLIVMALLLTACATTQLNPVRGEGFTPEEDEKRLWLRVAEEEKILNASDLIYHDEELETYLNDVAAGLLPQDVFRSIPFRIRVIKDPAFNAFAFPDGNLYIHTGILAKMDNEAQLASILGHEMAHATHRHTIREFRDLKNKAAFAAGLSVGLGGIGAIIGQVGALASIRGYSRELETEADVEGLRLLVNAGYDAAEAPKLFKYLQKEVEDEKIKESYFFGSHPRLQERVENFEGLLSTSYANGGGRKNADVFMRKIQSLLPENAQMNLRSGRFGKARGDLEKYLSLRPEDPRGHFLMGEMYRQRGENGDLSLATEQYKKSLSLDPAFAEPYRSLGLVAYKQKDMGVARQSFESYLSKAPRASDRAYIEEMLKKLR